MRGILTLTLFAGLTIGCCFAAYVGRALDATGDKALEVARFWGRWVCRLTGMRVTIRLDAPLSPEQPYVFMANHVSAADIWTLLATLPVRVRMIAKKQLGAIPLFGWAMRAGRFIFIDRKNPGAARRSMEDAADRIREGASVLLFPEGTRSRDGQLAPFKKGGFHLAINAGVPIVPIAVRGTFALLPRDTFVPRSGPVEILVGEPIVTTGLSDADRDALIERVRDAITALLKR